MLAGNSLLTMAFEILSDLNLNINEKLIYSLFNIIDAWIYNYITYRVSRLKF